MFNITQEKSVVNIRYIHDGGIIKEVFTKNGFFVRIKSIKKNAMYEKFYKLKEKPFNVTSDANFFFQSKCHQEAIAYLIYGISERKGILCITGEVGTGKTTLCRALLDRLEKDVKTAFILNPYFSEKQLLEAVVEDFGLHPSRRTKLALVGELNKFLLQLASEGKNAVLIIDESQNLNQKQLEQIRLLSNLETAKEKLLQIILVGQPELEEKLKEENLRQLKQRIMVHYKINPLDKDELRKYILHRLDVAGSNGRIRFEKDSIDEIYSFSCGVPRLINIICDLALLMGFVKGKCVIDGQIIQNVRKEFGK